VREALDDLLVDAFTKRHSFGWRGATGAERSARRIDPSRMDLDERRELDRKLTVFLPGLTFSSRRPRYSAVPNSVGTVSRVASDNPLGLGLIVVGAAAMAIAEFLPLVEPTGAFRTVEHNTLIQHHGLWLIALAFGIAASGYRVSQGWPKRRWASIVLCVIAAGEIVLIASNKGPHCQ
jgi:hypothetical protein